MSSLVLSSPRDRRMVQWACSSESPKARRAWEGLGEPERQAEPEEKEMPCWSRARTRDSPRRPGRVTFRVLGSRFPGARLIWPREKSLQTLP